ncbi:hypothetical protein OH708_08025 [Pseudomonas capsici]|uniref:hypothetical protein n=1 Tax=Pseudomonas capsici TaxID=2810614 RepID=UPI0021F1AA40|nr:hypothetical protein [Pseudomonas capsici]MCV4287849.1 hypothetical protein [Pseudomonas capsici]
MQLFHTSPAEIATINKNGRFGEFLFFSSTAYAMAVGEVVTYSVEMDDDSIIDAGSLFYHEDAEKLEGLVAELANRFEIDADTAEDLIAEKTSVYDIDGIEPEDMADASWDVQRFTAKAAKILGFRGVAVSDEQGTAYMIDMLGREQDLVRV